MEGFMVEEASTLGLVDRLSVGRGSGERKRNHLGNRMDDVEAHPALYRPSGEAREIFIGAGLMQHDPARLKCLWEV